MGQACEYLEELGYADCKWVIQHLKRRSFTRCLPCAGFCRGSHRPTDPSPALRVEEQLKEKYKVTFKLHRKEMTAVRC
jgi:hypothetical protein